MMNDINIVKELILKQARQIKCLKHQLEEYQRAASSENPSSSIIFLDDTESVDPTPSASIASTKSDTTIKPEYIDLTVPSARESRVPSAPLPINSKKKTVSTTTKRRILLQRSFKLNYLPSKRTFKKRIKDSIELDGYNQDAHFQHLIHQDSILSSQSKSARWNFAFRLCSYFVLSGRKILTKTLINGNKRDNNKTSISSFPGLDAFLKLKRIDTTLLEKPLSDETVAYFSIRKNQRGVIKFLYAFCSFLYTFLPQEKRVYKLKSNANEFHLQATVTMPDDEVEDNEIEIKEEVDSGSKLLDGSMKTENND
ncbi:hypothetical protein PS15m_006660 [Mucor circinelloides]